MLPNSIAAIDLAVLVSAFSLVYSSHVFFLQTKLVSYWSTTSVSAYEVQLILHSSLKVGWIQPSNTSINSIVVV